MSNQLQITGGAKVRSLEGVITGTSGVLSSLPINASNGIPQLDTNGKILVSQLPNSVMEYKGTWNAATNTPTLADGTGNQGDVYLCNVAGTINFGSGPITFYVGDQVIYSGTVWQRASGSSGTVTSVGLTSTAGAFTITNSPVTTSGNIGLNFSGNNTQYVAGDGSLVTFPSIITQAQNLVTEVYNNSGATMTKGTIVYINGGQGNLPTIAKALATSDATSAQTYGVVRADIGNMTNGYVTVIGNLDNIDTQAYAAGTQLYLSGTAAGTWTSTKPYAPAHLVYVGIVVRSHPTQGVIEVKIQNGYELDELHNVSAQTPSNNDGLFYESSTSLWKNKSIATVLGYTPADDSLVVKLAGTQTITGTKNFDLGVFLKAGVGGGGTGYIGLGSMDSNTLTIYTTSFATTYSQSFTFPSGSAHTYNFPNTSGTLALTSDLSSYVTLSTTQTISGSKTFTANPSISSSGQASLSISAGTGNSAILFGYVGGTLYGSIEIAQASYKLYNGSGNTFNFQSAGTGISSLRFNNTTNYIYDFPSANGTIALTSNIPTVSGTTNYLPKFTGTSTLGNSLIWDNGTNVGIGNTNTTYTFDVTGTGRFTGALTGTSATFSSSVGINGASTSYPLNVSGAASNGQFVVVSNVTGTGYGYNYVANQGSLQSLWGSESSGSFIGTNTNHYFYFLTNGTERMRITGDGYIIGGRTSTGTYTSRFTAQVISGNFSYYSICDSTSTGVSHIGFENPNGLVGQITTNSTSTSYNTSSDYRLKQDLKDYNGLDLVSKIKTYDYEWKTDNTRSYGVIAHELQEIIPQAVVGDKDGEMMQGVDYSKLVPILIKAIQEQQKQIDELKAKIN